MKTLVVNLFGGPGSGKSTLAAGLFSALKLQGILCELATEYAKDLVWAGRDLSNQVLILGKQFERLERVQGKVKVVVTDSPLLLTQIYNTLLPSLNEVAYDLHSRHETLNIHVKRTKIYVPHGRVQTETQANAIDSTIEELLFNLPSPAIYMVTGDAKGLEDLKIVVNRELKNVG